MQHVGMKAGTGKSRTDRHRIPYKPIGFRFDRKNRKLGKKLGKTDKIGIENGSGCFLTVFADLVFSRENFRDIPVLQATKSLFQPTPGLGLVS